MSKRDQEARPGAAKDWQIKDRQIFALHEYLLKANIDHLLSFIYLQLIYRFDEDGSGLVEMRDYEELILLFNYLHEVRLAEKT